MTRRFFEDVFMVTETLQNGNERTIRKSVFSPVFVDGKCNDFNKRIEKARKALKDAHYYNIVYGRSNTKTVLFTE